MRFDLVGRTVDDVDSSAVGPPAFASSQAEPLTRIRNPPVVFLLELVRVRARCRVATLPELLNEPLPLVICLERDKRLALVGSDHVDDVLVHPSQIRIRVSLRRLRGAGLPCHHGRERCYQ
jgi:hypothetical protein